MSEAPRAEVELVFGTDSRGDNMVSGPETTPRSTGRVTNSCTNQQSPFTDPAVPSEENSFANYSARSLSNSNLTSMAQVGSECPSFNIGSSLIMKADLDDNKVPFGLLPPGLLDQGLSAKAELNAR